MNTISKIRGVLLIVCSLLLAASGLAQGPLSPPAGPPGPTMKTLQQVEPRIDLQSSPLPPGVTTTASTHFVINQPGSYYLSANLGVIKTNGISISVQGVTLDLNGFQISRATGTGGNGIQIDFGGTGAAIHNGGITGFAYGIRSPSLGGRARGCSFRALGVSDCTVAGIEAGEGAVLDSCRVNNNSGSYGIYADEGSSLSNLTSSHNAVTYGIYASAGSSLTNCSALSNEGSAATSAGIGTGFGCTISHSTARENSSSAPSTGTTGMGFDVGVQSTIQNCTASLNKGDGINISADTVARENNCHSNGNLSGNGAGIHATSTDNRIEANNATNNDRGIEVSGTGSLIVKNSARGNGSNYEIGGSNRYGAIFDLTALGSAAASGDSAPGTLTTTTNPWANFSY